MSDTDELISTIFTATKLSYSMEKDGGRTLDKKSILSTTLRASSNDVSKYFTIRDVGCDVVQLKIFQADSGICNEKTSYEDIFNSEDGKIDCIDVIHRLFYQDPYQEKVFHGLNIIFRRKVCRIYLSQEAPTLFEISVG